MLDVLIIGAGPAGLFAAEHLSAKGLEVTVIDRMPSPARKFLMAGRGGLNLTHSEPVKIFLERYREAEPFLQPMISAFPPSELVAWCNALGEETFTGSSGRIFPKSMKASPLLRAWLRRLDRQGVNLLTRRTFKGFTPDGVALVGEGDAAPVPIQARAILLALGGASWPKLGSNAGWLPALRSQGIDVREFQPANCGFQVAWSDFVKDRFAGHPLKRIQISCGPKSVLGEAILSSKGLEGGAIYALSAEIRECLERDKTTTINIDLRPQLPINALTQKLQRPKGKQSVTTFLKKAVGLHPAELALLREAGYLPTSPEELAKRIKAVPVAIQAPYSIDRSISSAGGIGLAEVDSTMMLNKLPGVFVAGEMLDWEAPTGGYLLQACFSTGFAAANGIRSFLTSQTHESPSK
jgi:hypothetical protein